MNSGDICIILAGGQGTRLREILPDTPKCLAPVNDRSFLQILFDNLYAQGMDNFVVSLGYKSEQVLAVLKSLQVPYRVDSVIEERPLGTGGAVLYAMRELKIDEALVTNGDTYLEADLSDMLRPLERSSTELMRIASVRVDNRMRYGGLEVDAGRVTRLMEKGVEGAGIINAGFYRVHRDAFEGFEVGRSCSLETDVVPKVAAAGALTAASLDGTFVDIGVPDDYFRFCARFN